MPRSIVAYVSLHRCLAGWVRPGHSRLRWVGTAACFVAVTAFVSIFEPKLTDVLDIISSVFATLQVWRGRR